MDILRGLLIYPSPISRQVLAAWIRTKSTLFIVRPDAERGQVEWKALDSKRSTIYREVLARGSLRDYP